jgi:hypothetical protein
MKLILKKRKQLGMYRKNLNCGVGQLGIDEKEDICRVSSQVDDNVCKGLKLLVV